MKVIKLDAIDSTNDFLKGLSATEELENYTVVTAENQTKGRGQMGAVWNSEKSKNLIMSVFVKGLLVGVEEIYKLNIATALALIEVLKTFNIQNLSIKWPNDIMSANYKIAGILIENSFKSDGSISSVIGIGLNVNQTNFENLPKASSMAVITNSSFDKDELVPLIVEQFEVNLELINLNPQYLWEKYTEVLFKKGVPMPFKLENQKAFMGIIQGVSATGKLIVLLENDSIVEYGLKEIQMLY
ncbi:biotin--[acetyl-CoA-carboxylase] ligase [Flavobacterium sufflavum]|uniref:Biotin--[acetyl-CoA-carboxylase] ligase n=1 Tax=Flavobacterium sufflavum TaxID=1921138 RepID=A0A437KWM7_9FLAO|nr:biotin--[acetyl-CoA-carboxylase] ligase [Flavobacterium sufflavum]RVT76663.1 biotin--[acetyl-CoA-carboxylase] ligase [Flavobacterium sufflavum]